MHWHSLEKWTTQHSRRPELILRNKRGQQRPSPYSTASRYSNTFRTGNTASFILTFYLTSCQNPLLLRGWEHPCRFQGCFGIGQPCVYGGAVRSAMIGAGAFLRRNPPYKTGAGGGEERRQQHSLRNISGGN